MYDRRMPAEWAPHRAVWSAWPYLESEWGAAISDAKAELAAFLIAVADGGRGEELRILAHDESAAAELRRALGTTSAEVLTYAPYGDIWLRDTGPIVVHGPKGLEPICFDFNGWGLKYEMEGDDEVSGFVATHMMVQGEAASFTDVLFVLEGGSVDSDGEGTLLTTRSCLLNPNRNPDFREADVEAEFEGLFGAERVIWLDGSLLNDHTDGHVDTLARFGGPGRVVCMRPNGDDDPNRAVLEATREVLGRSADARGRPLDVLTVPSPGRCLGRDGSILPASYVNFYVSNTRVLVPTYGVEADEEAVEVLGAAFPDREVLGLSARAILEGGGAFHCMTQPQPRGGNGEQPA